LAVFWGIMLKIFMSTISFEKPKWILDESLIGTNPGLAFRPSPKVEKVDSTLIHFRTGQNSSYHLWVKDLEDFLRPYREQYNQRTDCRTFPTRNERCPFLPDFTYDFCGKNYGYDTGSPCVLIKLNRVYNWKPSVYRSVEDIKNGIREVSKIEPTIGNNVLNSGEGLIAVQCEGTNSADKERLSKIEYWPKQGFSAEYYPYLNQKDYLSPFVLVKFNNPSKDVVINIECIAMDKSIHINRYDHEGSIGYQLRIES